MNRFQQQVSRFPFPFLGIIAGGMVLSLLLYGGIAGLTGYNILAEPDPVKKLDGVVKVLGIAVSVTGSVAIVVTIIQSRQPLRRDIQQNSVAYFKELEFYLLVSIYEGNAEVLKALRFFYCGWWRHFLYDFALEVENRTQTADVLLTTGITYLQDISYTATLQRLDRLCGLTNIPPSTELHLDSG